MQSQHATQRPTGDSRQAMKSSLESSPYRVFKVASPNRATWRQKACSSADARSSNTLIGNPNYNQNTHKNQPTISRLFLRLLVFLADLLDQQLLQILEYLIPFLHIYQHRCLHIRQSNSDGPHLTASTCSNRSSFSTIAALRNAKIFRQLRLFSRSSAWWSL